MAKISPVGSNMTVLHGKKYDVLFSYETPVAAKDIKTGEVFKTSKKWSATTSKHISKWLAGEKASEKPQEFFDDLDESKKDPAKQIAEALNIMLKDKTLNESRFTQTDFGTVEYMGKRYTLKNQADFTNRLLPGNFVNYHDAEEGEEFDFEMAADATSESGEDCTVYWIFSHTKGESDSDWDSFDYSDVDRVDCEPLDESEEYEDLDEAKGDPLQNALDYLNKLIAAGKEFPDASSNAAIKFDVDIDDLTAAYDNQNLDESNLNESNDPLNSKDVINSTEIEELLQSMSEDDPEFKSLNSVKSEVIDFLSEEDWQDGVDLIRYSYFEDYIEEMSRELNSEFFEANQTRFPFQEYIDWERVSRDMEINDFASTEIDDVEYKFRSH